jgi:hypothetical protein
MEARQQIADFLSALIGVYTLIIFASIIVSATSRTRISGSSAASACSSARSISARSSRSWC